MIRIRCSAANTVALLRENMKSKPSDTHKGAPKSLRYSGVPVAEASKRRSMH